MDQHIEARYEFARQLDRIHLEDMRKVYQQNGLDREPKSDWYILDDEDRPVPIGLHEGGLWLELNQSRKIVQQDTLPNGYWVSTVFLGLNHSLGDDPPVLWETMVFTKKDGDGDLDMERYTSLEDAKKGHKAMCEEWSRHEPISEEEHEQRARKREENEKACREWVRNQEQA
jgi:hypothetical protein